MTRILVTISPPTPNGDLHLGHLSGPFLSADVFTRARRLLGDEVILLSYSDDYQSYLRRKASELGRNERELASENALRIEDTLRLAQIDLDHFLHAFDNEYFKRAVSLFYRAAVNAGSVAWRTDRVPYCVTCDITGYEAFARGRCNYCGSASDASQCEACARAPDVRRMGELTCVLCKQPMGWREIDREFLILGRYRDALRAHYADRPIRPPLRQFIHSVLESDNLDWFITRPLECGVDIDGETTVHTWFSGMAGYYAALEEFAAREGHLDWPDQYWRSPDTKIAQFLGFDCSFSHAIAYPALVMNFPNFTRHLYPYTNAFLKLDGGDFSTSRGHAIWIRDILNDVSSDALRLYIALIAPEISTQNFVLSDFRRWLVSDFAALSSITAAGCVEPYHPVGHSLGADEAEIAGAIKERWRTATDFGQFSIRSVAELLRDLARTIGERRTIGAPIRPLLAVYAVVGECIHPRLSRCLLADLNIRVEPLRQWLRDDRMATPVIELCRERAVDIPHTTHIAV